METRGHPPQEFTAPAGRTDPPGCTTAPHKAPSPSVTGAGHSCVSPPPGAVMLGHPAASLDAQHPWGGPLPLPGGAHWPSSTPEPRPLPASSLAAFQGETNHDIPSERKSPRLLPRDLERFGQSTDGGQRCATLRTARRPSFCRPVIFHWCFPSAHVFGRQVGCSHRSPNLPLPLPTQAGMAVPPRHPKSPSRGSLPSKPPQTTHPEPRLRSTPSWVSPRTAAGGAGIHPEHQGRGAPWK